MQNYKQSYKCNQNGTDYFLSTEIEKNQIKIMCWNIKAPSTNTYLNSFSLPYLKELSNEFLGCLDIIQAQKLINNKIEQNLLIIKNNLSFIDLEIFMANNNPPINFNLSPIMNKIDSVRENKELNNYSPQKIKKREYLTLILSPKRNNQRSIFNSPIRNYEYNNSPQKENSPLSTNNSSPQSSNNIEDINNINIPFQNENIIPEFNQNIIPEFNQNVVPESNQNIIPEFNQNIIPETNQNIIPESNQNIVSESNQNIIPEYNQNIVPESNQNIVPEFNQNMIPEYNQNLDLLTKLQNQENENNILKTQITDLNQKILELQKEKQNDFSNPSSNHQQENENLKIINENLINENKNLKSQLNNSLNQISPKVAFIDNSSNILAKGEIIRDKKELEFLCQKICKNYQYMTINLIYKATVDSDKSVAFHNNCDQASNSLVLIETDKNVRFGGYTSCNWSGNCEDKIDDNAFVFSLNKMKTYDVIPGEKAIGCYPKCGPVFLGCQIRIFDEAFTKGGTTYLKGANYQTEEDFELSGGEQKFNVKEIEVYKIELE